MGEKDKNKNRASTPKRVPIKSIIFIFSFIILILTSFAFVQRAVDDYSASIESHKEKAEQLTRSVSDHIELLFISVDQVLKRAVERQYFNALFGSKLFEDMENHFVKWVNETPQIASMMMTNSQGRIQVITRREAFRGWMKSRESGGSVRKQPWFLTHSLAPDTDQLYIGWHSSEVSGHSGFIVLSRRITKLDGTFGGIILVAVDTNNITEFFDASKEQGMSQFLLTRKDNQPLINQVSLEADSAILLSSLTKNTEISHQGEFSKSLKIYSKTIIPSFSLTLGIVSYGNDILAAWEDRRIQDLILFGVLVLFIVMVAGAAMGVGKQIQRVQDSERSAILSSQSKSEFLANMSHELRTPLNAIIGFSEMLAAGYFGKLNAKQTERVEDMHFCGKHLLELINDILEFSKGEAGKTELHATRVDLKRVIADTIKMFDARAKKKNIQVSSSLLPDLPPLLADARKIKQILINLLANAVNFTDSGGMVEVSADIDEDKHMVLSVSDNGVGIKEEDIPKALSVFGQVHDDPAKGGTGLGLPLVKMFAELHGGSVKIQSIEGLGTKVSILLPADRVLWSGISEEAPMLEDVKKEENVDHEIRAAKKKQEKKERKGNAEHKEPKRAKRKEPQVAKV